MSGRGKGIGHCRSGHGNNGERSSGRTSSRPRNNNRNNNSNKTEKVEFTPHCAGKTQGTTHDTVKKQIIHDIGSKCELGNDPAESIENNNQHKTKEDPWKHLGFADSTFVDKKNPTQLEPVDHTEFVKERNEQF